MESASVQLDPDLPEPETLGQAIAIARAGQQLQEEVGIVLVERPQSLGDDLDRFNARGRILGGARRRVDRARGGGGSAGRRLGVKKVAQVLGQVPRRAVPLRRTLRQRLLADPFQLPGDRVVDLPGGTGFDGGDLIHDVAMRVAPKGTTPREQLIEDHAQAEEIRAAIDPVALAPGLLGAHVGRSPGQPAFPAKVLLPERQPEVGYDRLVRRVEQDIGRLDVAVDQVPRMGVVQRLGDRRHQLGRLPKGHPALTQPVCQVGALDVLGDHVAQAGLGPAHVIDGHDVGMVELGEELGLGQVDRDVLGAGGPLGVGHLDRDRPAERVVLGQVDRPETASTQQPHYPVAADGRGKAGRGETGPGTSRTQIAGRVPFARHLNRRTQIAGRVPFV